MTSYLWVENAFKSFGDLPLFENISFGINEGDKTAIIAKNGAGKTTLLNILAGRDTFDAGSLYLKRDMKTAYLQQDPQFNPELSVFEAVYGSPGEMMNTVREYELSLHSHNNKRLEKATAQMDFHHAWDLDSRIRQMLGIFRLFDENQKVGTLSGGQIKRLAMVVALINDPDFLILDEPTNHLDLDMIEWLEEYLTKSRITLLMVTHDRYFLDRICHSIIEIDEMIMFTYNGNYSDFLVKRDERIINKSLTVEKAQNLLRTELEWMRRMPKARTTKAKYRIDAFYDLKEKSEYRRNDRQVEINVKASRLGKKILVLDKISKKFDDKIILHDLTYTFTRGEKLGIIGPNGSGKSTFLNIITQTLKADSGRVDTGETVIYGYYRQEGLAFKPGKRVIDIVRDIAEVITLGDGRQMTASQFLNHFLFPPGIQYVLVDKLSGGEKRRLYLMTILMQNPNFLVLDEPTNDFDIVTLNVLEDYLAKFNGCLIIVSHDRFFMDKLVDHMFIFEGDGEIYDFPGNYSDYRASVKKPEAEKKKSDEKSHLSQEVAEQGKPAVKKLSFKEKKELEQLTQEIESLEKEKKIIEDSLNISNLSSEELVSKSRRLAEILVLTNQKTDRWLELSE